MIHRALSFAMAGLTLSHGDHTCHESVIRSDPSARMCLGCGEGQSISIESAIFGDPYFFCTKDVRDHLVAECAHGHACCLDVNRDSLSHGEPVCQYQDESLFVHFCCEGTAKAPNPSQEEESFDGFVDECPEELILSASKFEGHHPPLCLACNAGESIAISRVSYGSANQFDEDCGAANTARATRVVRATCHGKHSCCIETVSDWLFSGNPHWDACPHTSEKLSIDYCCLAMDHSLNGTMHFIDDSDSWTDANDSSAHFFPGLDDSSEESHGNDSYFAPGVFNESHFIPDWSHDSLDSNESHFIPELSHDSSSEDHFHFNESHFIPDESADTRMNESAIIECPLDKCTVDFCAHSGGDTPCDASENWVGYADPNEPCVTSFCGHCSMDLHSCTEICLAISPANFKADCRSNCDEIDSASPFRCFIPA